MSKFDATQETIIYSLGSLIKGKDDQIEQYQHLVENLKGKIKDLSGKLSITESEAKKIAAASKKQHEEIVKIIASFRKQTEHVHALRKELEETKQTLEAKKLTTQFWYEKYHTSFEEQDVPCNIKEE